MPVRIDRSRRLFAASLGALALGPAVAGQATQNAITFALTPVILDDQAQFLSEFGRFLERQLGRPIVWVQRSTYRDIMDLLLSERVDFAWICGYPYVRYRSRLQLISVPVYQGAPLYRSLLIVPQAEAGVHGYADLRGKVFAYSDPDSNSGWLVAQTQLRELGVDPATYFRRTFFTRGHRKVVQAVAQGIAQAGSVDGYVWDTLAKIEPALTARTRVAWRSDTFAFPPIVGSRHISPADASQLRAVLASMNANLDGQALLKQLNLDGFAFPPGSIFDGIAQGMARARVPA